jgi:hypothetical protein
MLQIWNCDLVKRSYTSATLVGTLRRPFKDREQTMANAVFLSQALDGLRASVAHLGDVIKQRDFAIANLNEKLTE